MEENQKDLGYIILDGFENEKEKQITLDNCFWKINKKCKGFKNVPFGLHIFYFKNPTKINPFNITKKFFYLSSKNKVVILKFSKNKSLIELMSTKETNRDIYIGAIENNEIQNYLVDYTMENFDVWKEMTKFISENLLERIYPTKKNKTKKEDSFNEEENTNLKLDEGFEEEGNFLELDIKLKKENKITIDNYLDRTDQILDILKFNYEKNSEKEFLGEYQMGFLSFFLFGNNRGLEFFKKITFLITESEKLFVIRKKFCEDFLKMFYLILKQLSDDFFYDDLTKENFLKSTLSNLMEILENLPNYHLAFKNFDFLLKNKFHFEWQTFLFNKEFQEFHLNELKDKDSLPILFDEKENFISF